jgi:8-oxo-dGTP pyrophosphatase MutT (NUDIX family)
MKKHSCGAILYTVYNGNIYIVLGLEKGEWFPFKGTREKGETNTQAAIREIYEETCEIVKVESIDLGCNYSTKRKHYHIGVIFVSFEDIYQFHDRRKSIANSPCRKNKWAFLEKNDIRFFKLDTIFKNDFHDVTLIPIRYYHTQLNTLQNVIHKKLQNKFAVDASPNHRSTYLHTTNNIDRMSTIGV